VKLRTGELLVRRGVTTASVIEAAVRDARERGEPLCSRLLELSVDERHLAAALAEQHGVPGVDLSRTAIALELLALVPRAVAEADLILPLSDEGGRLHLATCAPSEDRAAAEVRFVTGREVSKYVAVKAALERAIAGAYEALDAGETVWRGAAAEAGLPSLAVVVAEDEVLEVIDVDEQALDGEVVLEANEEVAPEPVPPRPARADDRRLVLVVDDEPEIRQLVQRALEKTGYAVETAADGAQALALAEAIHPDLVLLDAMLPKVHGFEACRRLKSAPTTRDIPVVMMTAIYRGWRFAQDARDAYGAEDYIEKPFRLDDLLRRVAAAIDATSTRSRTAPPSAGPLVQRGKELLLAGRAPEALPILEEAVATEPYSGEAHYQLARALRATADHFRAMSAFERAVELRPGHLSALRALAALYEEKGFRRKAAETLERALGAATDDPTRGTIREDLLALLG
jgi:CheY-like chemotaxis protein